MLNYLSFLKNEVSLSTNIAKLNSYELVIFDSGVENLQQLIDGIKPGIDWVVLNQNQDGVEQITRILANHPGIKTLHIISHGAPGCLFLGNTQLNLATLEGYTTQLQSWFKVPQPPFYKGGSRGDRDLVGSLLLYSCNVAAGDAGEEFIHKLHSITQANIAASRTLTGSPQHGGNWNFDVIIGHIEAELAFNTKTQTTYAGILADPVAADDNLGAAGTTGLDVLGNDTDADGDRLQIASIDTAPSHGTAIINDWIYAVGDTTYDNPSGYGTLYNGMVRFNSDGSRDTHFNVNAYNYFPTDIALDQSGQPVIGGRFTTVNDITRNGIARLNTNGILDISFDPGAGIDNQVNAITIDENGKIVVAGDFTTVDGTARNKIARLNTDGTLDTTFDPGAGMDDQVNAIAIDENGKIVVGGDFTTVDGTARNKIARLNSDGTLDTSFDSGAGISTMFSGVDYGGTVRAFDFDSSGKIIVGGNFNTVDGTARNNIARLNSDGTLDTTFDPGTGMDGIVSAIAIDENDQIVVGGWFNSVDGTARNNIARLNSDGSLDTTFDPGAGMGSFVEAIAIDENDGKIIAGGYFTNVDGTTRNYIARLNTDGSLDTSFDPGTIFQYKSNAIAINPQSNILYTPDAGFNGIDTLTYTIVDPDSNTSTPATLEILVNNSPVVTGGTAILNNQDQDDSNSSGTLVSEMIGSSYVTVTDADASADQGIAITHLDTSNGSWQYTTDGTNWIDAPTVAETNALLLASDTNSAIRFVPNAGYSGILTNAIQFAAWDQLTGNNGDTADYTTDRYIKHNASVFSSKIVPGRLTVQPPPATVVRVYADSTEDGVRVVGDNVFIKVQFSEPVTYSGTVYLDLETGATDTYAYAIAGKGTDTLTFRYWVRTTDEVSPDLDYLSTTALRGSITNTALTADAVLTLPEPGTANSLSDNNEIIVGVSNAEIKVSQGTTEITDDTTTAFDFGTTPVGTPVTQTFTVNNVGTDDLTLTNPITLTGTGFELVSSTFTDTTLASGESTTFDVTLQATNVGTATGNLSFNNNDSDESPFNFPVTGTVVAAIPEIEVTQGTINIADDATVAFDLGSTTIGTPITKTFNIKNTGTGDLTLNNPITLTGTGFELVSTNFTDTTLTPGEITSFAVTLQATDIGAASGAISFANNDSDESPFNFPISGSVTEVPVPEIEVTQGTTDIPDGEFNPAFDFGTTPLYTPVTKTFTVKNTGTADLTLINPIQISGTGFDLVSSTFADTRLAPGESTTFDVTLQASEASSQGFNNGVISFINDDSDESPFDFKVEGFVDTTGFGEIEVIHGTTNITYGTTTPIDLGTINWGESALKTFTVKNTGVSNLILTNPIAIAGKGFELTRENFTRTTLRPGDSTNFSVRFTANDPADTRGFIAAGNLSITSDDGDESLFNFPIQVNVNPALLPEIEVFEGTTEIQDGTTTPIDFEPFPVGKPFTKTFTVKNTGTAQLSVNESSLSLPPGIQMISSLFENGNNWASVAPGESTTFDITLVATVAGAFTGELSFDNNDSDFDFFHAEGHEHPFNFPIKGFVTAPEIAVKDGSLDIADGTATAVDWDEVRLNHQITKTFIIENSGDADLELGDLSLAGNGLKLISSTFVDTIVAPGQSTTVDVTIEGTVEGTATGTLSLANNDLDESDFDFPIQVEVTEPEIEVAALGTIAFAGGETTPLIPSITDDTTTPIEFAPKLMNTEPVTQKFVVKNTGTGHLSLTNPINLTGTGFELVSSHLAQTDLAPGESTTFEVILKNTVGGDYQGEISFESNDRDEAVFNFPIAGTVRGPNIEVTQGTTQIIDDTTTPIDLGTGITLGEPITKTFTVKNTGNIALPLSDITLNLPNNSGLETIIARRKSLKDVAPVFDQYITNEREYEYYQSQIDEILDGFFNKKPEFELVGGNPEYYEQHTTFKLDDDPDSDSSHSNIKDYLYYSFLEDSIPDLATPTTLLYPGETATFDVTFASDWEGDYTGNISFDAFGLGEFNFPIKGRIEGPEIEVKVGTQDISGEWGEYSEIYGAQNYDVLASKGIKLDEKSWVNFGSQQLFSEAPIEKTFTITNTGKGNLKINRQPYIKDASEVFRGRTFELVDSGTPWGSEAIQILEPGASKTFTIDFNGRGVGIPLGHVFLDNNDLNESLFHFPIYGEVFTDPSGPEISVFDDDGTEIISQSGYVKEFPTTLVGIPMTEEVVVINSKSVPLTTDKFDRVQLDPDSSLATVRESNITSGTGFKEEYGIGFVGPNGDDIPNDILSHLKDNTIYTYSEFQDGIVFAPIQPDGVSRAITLDAKAAGTHTATISLPTNDSDENPFVFQVRGAVETIKPKQIAAGIDQAFTGIDTLFKNHLKSEDLPFIGNHLQSIIDDDWVEGIKEQLVQAFLQEGMEERLTQAMLQDESNQASNLQKTLESALGDPRFKVTSEVTQEGVEWQIEFTETYSDSIPMLKDLGLPSLGLETDANVDADFTSSIQFDFGYKPVEGFYFDTKNTWVKIESDLELKEEEFKVTSSPFGLFPVQVKDAQIGGFVAPQLRLSMKDVGEGTDKDGELTLEEIQSVSASTDLFNQSFGSVQTDPFQEEYYIDGWDKTLFYSLYFPRLSVQAETILPDNAPIPSYNFDLVAEYARDEKDSDHYNPIATIYSGQKQPNVYLENMQANFGPFIANFLKPVMNAINEVVEPVRPIIDFFNRRITPLEIFEPVRDYFDVNDNDKVNLLEVAQKLSKGGNYSSIIAFMDALITLDEISNSLNDSISRLKNHPDMLATDLGSYRLNLDATNASANLTQAPREIIGSKPASPLEQIVENNPGELISEILLTLKSLETSAIKALGKSLIPAHVWDALEYTVSQVDLEKIQKDDGLPDLPELKGMDIPILYETDKALDLLTGEIENLFTYKLPTLDFKFDSEIRKKLKEIKDPIFKKTIVTLNALIPLGIGVKTNLGFGFDTQGLTEWQEGGFKADDTDKFMNGLYISDRLNADGTGPDVNELKLYGSIGLGMEADVLGVVKGQIRGTIDAYPNFDLIDVGENAKNKTDGDGKVHIFSELLPRMGDAIEMNGSVYASLSAVIKALGWTVYNEKIATYKIADFTYGSTSYKRSRAIDGYLAGSDAFFDANQNGIKDEDEPRTRTNADGSFDLTISLDKYDLNDNGEIDWSEGKIIIENGFDIATLLPLTTPLSSIPEATVVTPLTTLIASLVDLGIDPQTAESLVKASLNLPADVDLNRFDPLEAITLNDGKGLPVFGSMIAVQNTIVQIAELIDGVSELPRHQIASTTVTAITRQIQDQPTVDLTQLETITAIIQDAITEITVDEPNINQAQLNTVTAAAAQVISQGNNLIQEILESGISPQEAALQITRLQAVAVGQVTVGLSELALGTQSVEEFLAANTVAQIKQRAAEVEVNDPTIRPTVEEVVPELDWSTFYESLAELNIPSSFIDEPVDEPSEPTEETEESVDEPTDNPTEEATDKDSQPQLILTPPLIPELQSASVETSTASATAENFYDPTLSIPVIVQPVQPANAAVEVISNRSSNGEPTPNADVILGDGTDNLIHALAGDDIVSMGDGNDWISANQGNDIVDGENGNDTVHGGQDNDTVFGSADNDWINGNKGTDFLDGGEAMDTLYGGEDSDTLQGNAGEDWLSGNKGADFLDGGDGVDTLFAGQDNDTLQGGADNDELCGNVGADLMEGNDGNDLLYGGQDHDTVSGNNGDDIIYGDRGNDLLDGNVANDTLDGGEGDDTLDGGEGDDQLMGDAGDDVLFGAVGNDTLTGGEGSDRFVLTPGSGSNLITDFTDGEDIIVIEDDLTFEQLTIETSQNATIVKFNEEILTTLNGVESTLITADEKTQISV